MRARLHRAGVVAGIPDPDYKSSYPQLHQVLSGAVSAPGITRYDGYKSSYPQLHVALSHQVAAPLVQTGNSGFEAGATRPSVLEQRR